MSHMLQPQPYVVAANSSTCHTVPEVPQCHANLIIYP